MPPIQTGNQIKADTFRFQSERAATPSDDNGKVPKLESDGRLSPFFVRNGAVLNCGETINGATLPVPVYQDTADNELYACDANVLTKLKFIGFVTSNGTDGNPATFQGVGVVSGFTGLQEGQDYYLQDAVGTIGTTPGTYEVLVGIAISETQLLIQKGRRVAHGTTTFTATGNQTIDLGFKPTRIRITVQTDAGGAGVTQVFSFGAWSTFGGNDCIWQGRGTANEVETGVNNSNAWYVYTNGTANLHNGTIDTITDTSFRLVNTKTGSPADAQVIWEAEGDI